MLLLWLQFSLCAALIVYSGIRLSQCGDEISEITGWGRTWIGVILLASVTSLPELVTGVSSVTVADVPNIAVGDILGSCVLNLTIIVFISSRGVSSASHFDCKRSIYFPFLSML